MDKYVLPNRVMAIVIPMMIAWLWITPWKADLRLVTSEDTLYVYGGPIDDQEPLFSQEISGFRNYDFFNRNNSIPGRACYIFETGFPKELIREKCINQIDTWTGNWILILPFETNNFQETLQDLPKSFPTIQSVIFTYIAAPEITGPAPSQNQPQIISFARTSELANITEKAVPKSDQYFFKHKHKYIEYWDVMKPAFKFYLITISTWGLITVFHILWTWILRKDYSQHLQKILLFIPVFFAGYSLIDYVYFMSCPWITANGVQYLQIVQIALVTIFNTLFVGLTCFISKGWSIVRNSFTREELSSITMIVGIFYLVYSAYFIASDISSLRVVIVVILILMYLWVALTCLKNSIVNIRTLKSHIAVTGPEEVIMKSLKLKKYLMQHFWIITMLFYLNKIIHSALKAFIDDNITVRNIIIANLFIELLIVGYFLLIFRTRKWPEYFSLDIFYQRIGNGDADENLPTSIILNAVTSSQWVNNPESKDWMINGDEADTLGKYKYKTPQVGVLVNTSDKENCKLFKLLRDEEILSDSE